MAEGAIVHLGNESPPPSGHAPFVPLDPPYRIPSEIGARVEKFTVTKKLGEGTFGAVYKVL